MNFYRHEDDPLSSGNPSDFTQAVASRRSLRHPVGRVRTVRKDREEGEEPEGFFEAAKV
ncbi:MAG TPA: hypothetical protein PKZ65_09800 [Methanoregulaceae archaeon]|nr:hypothetical protein [Methanoregulaceae archaeon]